MCWMDLFGTLGLVEVVGVMSLEVGGHVKKKVQRDWTAVVSLAHVATH